MGAIRLFKVWLVIGLMVLSGGSIAFAQTNTFPSSGSVGIGTTSPSSAYKLDLQAAPSMSAGDAHFRVQSNSGTNTSAGVFVMANSTGHALYMTMGDSSVTNDYLVRQGDGVLATTTGAGLAINTNSTQNNGLYINTSGNVGIGTTSPSSAYKLDLQAAPSMSAGDAHFRVQSNSGTNTSAGAFVMANSTGHALYMTMGDSSVTNDYLVRQGDGVLATTTGAGLAINTNSTQNNGLYINTSGNVGIGTTSPTSKLHVAGDATIDGNIAAKYQDVAEWVRAPVQLAPGTVVVIDPAESNRVLPSSQSYDTRIAGVVSSQPGIILGEAGDDKAKVAHSGRVKVKADARFGSIEAGDLLVSSATAGYAMRSTPIEMNGIFIHRPGTIVGKALEPLKEGQGEILVLLTLQ